MIEAVAEARDRWPEFVEAFHERREGEWFSVKVPVTVDGVTEFIWVEVTGIEPEYIHGTLGNDPVDLGGLKMGDVVEVPVAELNDWSIRYPDGDSHGMFTLEAIDRARERFYEERDQEEE